MTPLKTPLAKVSVPSISPTTAAPVFIAGLLEWSSKATSRLSFEPIDSFSRREDESIVVFLPGCETPKRSSNARPPDNFDSPIEARFNASATESKASKPVSSRIICNLTCLTYAFANVSWNVDFFAHCFSSRIGRRSSLASSKLTTLTIPGKTFRTRFGRLCSEARNDMAILTFEIFIISINI